ncbi:MAG TPA: ABC transporter ATP-binding protein [Solirubrobacteraceae bacterium]|nr:ABC transporter ATP-binding protein [Solirubrobacteraceae bacterium]
MSVSALHRRAEPALATCDLGKRYGRRWALSGCTLEVPAGHVAGLVGPNGAGKTTLLHLAVGLLAPSAGSIAVLGEEVDGAPAQLARVGFVAQDTPLYPSLSVAEHVRLGAALNPGWDAALARARIERLGLEGAQRAGTLSGGQRAQLALTLAVAKRPELLVLDEPVASLDPLARREFLQGLMEFTAEHTVSVVLSSHLVADLERVCDYAILLADGRVALAGEVDELLASHRRLSGPRRDGARLPASQQVIEESHTERQSTLLVRSEEPIVDPAWSVEEVGLEEIVLAYMGAPADRGAPLRPTDGAAGRGAGR